jgi:hypothetical protein
MTDKMMALKPRRLFLDQLLLDPNNPRLARSLNIRALVDDPDVGAVQAEIAKLFVNDTESEPASSDEDWVSGEGAIGIGDLVRSMQEIGFVRVDQVVVRQLKSDPEKFLVIEGNRRIAAAKYVRKMQPRAELKSHHEQIVNTLDEIEVLMLDIEGLSDDELHHQIGVILGLRHFGQVLPWGVLARAVNIYHEYMRMPPEQMDFKLEAARVGRVATLLSEGRSSVLAALKTYVAYQQLKEVFPAHLLPQHYSLLQACVVNKKLAAHNYLAADPSTFRQAEESLEHLNTICEFEHREVQNAQNILPDPKAVSKFAHLLASARGHADVAVRGHASSLLQQVFDKELSVDDASAQLGLFQTDRKWVQALSALLAKVEVPGESVPDEDDRLRLRGFDPAGNELMALADARKAFNNVRRIFRT